MLIHVQGEARELADGCLLAELLASMDLQGQRIAVEINQEVIPRSQHSQWRLQPGDRVEIVRAIGGG